MAKVYSLYLNYLFPPQTVKAEISERDNIHCQVPSCARSTSSATFRARLTKQNYLCVTVPYNARSTVYMDDLTNAEELWSYGDHHGMRWQMFARIDAFPVTFRLSVPGHHGHYWIYVVITLEQDGTAKIEEDFTDAPEV